MVRNVMMLGVLLAGATFSITGVAGTVYKWVDDQGQVHYGDHPQTDQAKALDIHTPAASDNDSQEPDKARPAATTAHKKKDEPKPKMDEQKREVRCTKSKELLQNYESAHRLFEKAPDGNQRVLSDEEREKITEEVRKDAEKYCTQ